MDESSRGDEPRAPGAEVSAPVAESLERMRSRADLFGFAITSVHGLPGLTQLKRILRRLLYQVFDRQTEFNEAATGALEHLVRDDLGAQRNVLVQTRILARTEERIAGLERRLAALQEDNTALRSQLEEQRVDLARTATGAESELPSLDYVSLQARFRGDETEIAERQARYVECFAGQQMVLDIGCGRGEFLRLLVEAGIEARGVDLDQDMVDLCRAHGLEVSRDDGLSYLARLEDSSLGGVFAAQVIEHLTPAQVVTLVRTAHRKLRPGGVLVLETVNPTSVVALMNFYLDFTHVKPIHPLALEWLAEDSDFTDTELLYEPPVEDGRRLHKLPEGAASAEQSKPFDDAVAATNEVLYGPRDYALIARRR